MTAAIENVAEPRVCASTERVRQHRERRRNGLRLMTVAMPEANIEHAITRGLLKPEDRTKPLPVIQACYASWLSDTAMQWLIRNGVINGNERGDTAAILRRISNWLEQARP
jgi:AcrR family transcriptional regulator